jgi:hypothetical protein
MGIFEACSKPKLLVVGGKSRFVSRPTSKSVSVAVIPDAGHFLLKDQPKLTLEAIHRFLPEQFGCHSRRNSELKPNDARGNPLSNT